MESKQIQCDECKIEASQEDIKQDRIRMYKTKQGGLILCECCYDDYQEKCGE